MKTINPILISTGEGTTAFRGADLGFTRAQLARWMVERPFTRASGKIVRVTMTRDHWEALYWLVSDGPFSIPGVRDGVERVWTEYSFSQRLTWWVEVAFKEVSRIQEERRTETA